MPCELKRKFETEQAAAAELANTIRRRAESPRRRECRYYRCPQCLCYHLTSMPLATARGRR